MHPNPAFRGESRARSLAFARTRGFGVLTLAGPEGPLASHLPYLLSPEGERLDAHIARSNPIRKALEAGPAPALLVVQGPHSYVSPDWYGAPEQVPTWNYVAVHLWGALRLAPSERLRPHLDALTAQFEAALAPKPPWTTAANDDAFMARMMRMILPVEMAVERVDGTWKLNQNKPEAVRLAAADGVEAAGLGDGLAELAELMRGAG